MQIKKLLNLIIHNIIFLTVIYSNNEFFKTKINVGFRILH